MKVKIIQLPTTENKKMDVNDYLTNSNNTIDDFKKLTEEAKGTTEVMLTIIPESTEKVLLLEELEDKGVLQYLLTLDDLEAINQFRNIIAKDKRFNLTARETDDYVRHLRKLQKEKAKKEKEQEKRKKEYKQEENEGQEKDEEITAEDKEAAMNLLHSPTLLYDILSFIQRLGVSGEEKNVLMHYVTFTSRIIDDPISEVVKGGSSAGKSYVVLKVMEVFPRSAYRDITDATSQSFYHVEKDYFAHRIIIIFERHGSEKTDYSIRSFQSEKKLKLQITVKDPETGQFVTKEKEVNGPTGFITTTTDARIHNENETRNLSIYPDESEDQTIRTFKVTGAKYRPTPAINQDELRHWKTVQRLLKPYRVFIPFEEEIQRRFPTKPIRVRRDYDKCLAFISIITILHQEQREKITVDGVEWLKATLADLYHATEILEESLGKTIYELPPKSEELVKAAKDVISEKDVSIVMVKELALKLDWNEDTVNIWIKPALQKGYLNIEDEPSGRKGATYKVTDKKIESIKILPTLEELYEINPDWLGNSTIYDPLSGEEFDIKDDSTDDPMPTDEGENTHAEKKDS